MEPISGGSILNVSSHIRTWTARLRAAKAMRLDAHGRQAEIDGCCAAITELRMVRAGSTIAKRKALRLDELNYLAGVGDASGYVVALYALIALARVEMDDNDGAHALRAQGERE